MVKYLKGSKKIFFDESEIGRNTFWDELMHTLLPVSSQMNTSYTNKLLQGRRDFNLVYLHHHRSVFRLFICKCMIWGTIKCWQSRLQSYQLHCIFHNFSNWHLWWWIVDAKSEPIIQCTRNSWGCRGEDRLTLNLHINEKIC